jgi:FlaA1/EpsC-like NDP-sugar epimerase
MFTSNMGGWRRFLPGPSAEIRSKFADSHSGQSVLVTGAGGYIGSALSLAIARANPSCLVLVDASEQNLYEIDVRMTQGLRSVPRQAVLGSVGDAALLDQVLTQFVPKVVYHAAAFKHVPLLELNPLEAVRNNILGTYLLAQAALRHGVSKLILVSTDKAVNPRSVMGVSKRIAELIVVALSNEQTRMNAIRLGNVIGSPGSVVPAFLRQIAARESVTVTHAEASRWFLSLGEAVQAILQAGAAACEARVLVPELGEPVRIAKLAEFLIQETSHEVPVVFTGLRPGDKLTEELVSAGEIRDGVAEGLRVIKTCQLTRSELDEFIRRLSCRIASRDRAGLIQDLCRMVPEYTPSRLQV